MRGPPKTRDLDRPALVSLGTRVSSDTATWRSRRRVFGGPNIAVILPDAILLRVGIPARHQYPVIELRGVCRYVRQ